MHGRPASSGRRGQLRVRCPDHRHRRKSDPV